MHTWVRLCPRTHASVTLHMCVSLFMPVKSCYRRQQWHCSPPMQPPWRNSPQPLAHMIAPHCSRLLLLARPDLPLKSKGGRPPSPTPALLYCLLWGRKVNTSRRLWLNLNVLGQKCRETNWSGEKGWLVFFSFFLHSVLPVRSELLINPYRVRPRGSVAWRK